jgi:hypothetical protein
MGHFNTFVTWDVAVGEGQLTVYWAQRVFFGRLSSCPDLAIARKAEGFSWVRAICRLKAFGWDVAR